MIDVAALLIRRNHLRPLLLFRMSVWNRNDGSKGHFRDGLLRLVVGVMSNHFLESEQLEDLS